MVNREFDFEAFRDLLDGASIVGRLALREQDFRSTYFAFRQGDHALFQDTLKRLGVFSKCCLVGEWIRSNECALLCLDLCGEPAIIEPAPDPRVLAEAITGITANTETVRQLLDTLDNRDAKAFQSIAARYGIGPFSYLFCDWLCVVRYRLIGRRVCAVEHSEMPNAALELRAAGEALRRLLAREDFFERAVAATDAGAAGQLAFLIEACGLKSSCRLLCEWLCSWHRSSVSLALCSTPSLRRMQGEIEEALDFARATKAIARNPESTQRLIAAILTTDRKAWTAVLKELQLQCFRLQLCQLVCLLTCRRFCSQVCPLMSSTSDHFVRVAA